MTSSKKLADMRPHEKLDIWIRLIKLVTRIYELTKSFPIDEKYLLTSQIRRSAVSIPANIAEGSARQTRKEYRQFLSIAQGSSSELETELLIAFNLGYLATEHYMELKDEIGNVSRMMLGLSKYLTLQDTK